MRVVTRGWFAAVAVVVGRSERLEVLSVSLLCEDG